MAQRTQFIRGTTSEQNAFTGLVGEVTVDTSKSALRVHDGVAAGGVEQARADAANIQPASGAQDGKLTAAGFNIIADALVGAANLSDVGDAPTALANLNGVNLDDVGESGADKVLKLTSAGDLPALDGTDLVDVLHPDSTDNLTVGFTQNTPHDYATKSSGTFEVDFKLGKHAKVVNDGAYILDTVTGEEGGQKIHVTNGSSAGAVDMSTNSFVVKGDEYVVDDTFEFVFDVNEINGRKIIYITALQ